MATRKITNGPSKFDFMNALFDGKQVQFTIEGLGVLDIIVHSVATEDGSRQRWVFQFHLADGPHRWCKGYYNTCDRTGWVESSQPDLSSTVPDPSGARALINQLKAQQTQTT